MLTDDDRAEMAEKIGHDPARWLDKPLFTGAGPGDSSVGYDTTSDPIEAMQQRIRGIDRLQVVAVWLTAEHRLERGPRDRVVSMLEDRRDYLEEEGQRDLPTRSRAERRKRAQEQYEQAKDQKLGRRDISGPYRSGSYPWPTGKERLDDDRDDHPEQDDQQEPEQNDQHDDHHDQQEEQEMNPEDHPLIQGFEQAGGTVATDGGQHE